MSGESSQQGYRCSNCGGKIPISPIVVNLETYCSTGCRDA